MANPLVKSETSLISSIKRFWSNTMITVNIESLRRLALDHYNALESGDNKNANKLYFKLKSLLIDKNNQKEIDKIIILLLDDGHSYVRQIAAGIALGRGIQTKKSIRILDHLSKRRDIGIHRLESEMILKQYRKNGFLNF
jgi:hypothetical protein